MRSAMTTTIAHRPPGGQEGQTESASDDWLGSRISEVLHRRPAVGLAVSIVGDDVDGFVGHGLADIASATPISDETVFRIGSITKTMTAVAVMQLWERGLVDLDAPAENYLNAYRLVPAEDGWRPVTMRHLLTHTSGIPDVLHVGDLLHPSWGPFAGRPPLLSAEVGEKLPSLAEYYRKGVPVVDEPGSVFAYSNHGFAALGQMVEEVSGQSLDRYFRQHVFEPLGMEDSTLVRSEGVESRLARGYDFGPRGPKAIADREWIGAGGGGVYSSSRDMVRYVKALLGAGSNEHGSVLAPATVAMMFECQYQPDSRMPGVGLGFFRHNLEGHGVLGHDGILPGFNSSLMIAPDEGVGLVALTNGSRGAMAWLPQESEKLLKELAGITDDVRCGEFPQHPEIWDRVCGRYRLSRVGDLRGRVGMGDGCEVRVAGGRLMIRLLTPIPTLYRGFPLLPDDPDDPYIFRVDLSTMSTAPVRLVFTRDEHGRRLIHTDLGGQPISLYEKDCSERRFVVLAYEAAARLKSMCLVRGKVRKRVSG